MSQRKAMKKTLKRLRLEALTKIREYNETQGYDDTDDYELYITAADALKTLYTYTKSLEYAYSEYDEWYEKALARKQGTLEEPAQKKEKTKYIR